MSTRSSVTMLRTPSGPRAIESAIEEITRQLEQGYALVSAAKAQLVGVEDAHGAVTLLEMAEDVLADLEYVNRLAVQS
jgi:uncharacterized protein HemX